MAVAAQRPPAHREIMLPGMMGMFIFLTSEVMFFGSLFAMYFYLHGSHTTWPPEGTTPVSPWPIPTVNTVILLSSGVTMHVAHSAIQKGDRGGLIRWLIPTIVLGLLFEFGQAFEFIRAYGGFGTASSEVLRFNTNEFASAFFTMTGFHGLHVLGGLILLTLILYRAARGQFSSQHHVGVAAVTLYWHFVDVVWIFLFGILYLGITLFR